MGYQYGMFLLARGHTVTFLLLENRIDSKYSSAPVRILNAPSIRSSFWKIRSLAFPDETIFISLIPHYTIIFRVARMLRHGWKDRFIYTIHNNLHRDFGTGLLDRACKVAYLNLLRSSKNVYAVSSDLCKSLLAFGINASPLLNRAHSQVRLIDRPDQGCLHLVMAGRLSAQKDYHAAIKFFRQLEELGVNFDVDVFGEGPMEKELRQALAELGLDQRVRLLGYREDLEVALEDPRYSALLLTSSYEGFGLVIVEALKKGIYPIVRDCDFGPREIVSYGVGYLLPFKFDRAHVRGAVDAWKSWSRLPWTERQENLSKALSSLELETEKTWNALESYQ